jgi:uncharacterized membrane protein YfcA
VPRRDQRWPALAAEQLRLAACIATLGLRNAVVLVTIAQLAATAVECDSKVHRRLIGVFSLGAIRGAAAGALLVTATPTDMLARIIGSL